MHSSTFPKIGGAAAAAVAILQGIALACPVCFGTSQAGVLRAFYLSTGILTTLPFFVIGGIAFFVTRLRRRTTPGPLGNAVLHAQNSLMSVGPASRPRQLFDTQVE
jgi:hypothetical protein